MAKRGLTRTHNTHILLNAVSLPVLVNALFRCDCFRPYNRGIVGHLSDVCWCLFSSRMRCQEGFDWCRELGPWWREWGWMPMYRGAHCGPQAVAHPVRRVPCRLRGSNE
ncbi:hypothetical protein V8E53_011275 [Lactarius tabidus]